MADTPPPAEKRDRSRLRLWVVVFLVLTAGLVIVALTRSADDDAVAVRLATAQRESLKSVVRAQGRVRARRQVSVGPEISGRIKSVDVAEGQTVEQGQVLFTLEDEQLRQNRRTLRAAVKSAETVVQRAELVEKEAARQLDRDAKLVERGAVSKEQMVMGQNRLALSQADTASARANLERTQIELARAQDTLEKSVVHSPLTGTAVAVGVEVGQVVGSLGTSVTDTAALGGLGFGATASASTDEVVVADLTDLVAELSVDEIDVTRLAAGQKTVLSPQSGKDDAVSGVLERVGLLGKEQSGAVFFPAWVKLDPGEKLLSGMSVDAEIEVARLDDAVVIPLSAVLPADKEKKDRVYVASQGAFGLAVALREVTLGPADGDRVAIEQGLDADDRVVTGPYRALVSLHDGDAIKVMDDTDKTGDADR